MNCPNTVTVTVAYEIIRHVFLLDTSHKVHKEFIKTLKEQYRKQQMTLNKIRRLDELKSTHETCLELFADQDMLFIY